MARSRKRVKGSERREHVPANTNPAGNRRTRRSSARMTTTDDVPMSRHGQQRRSKRVAGNRWRRR